VKVSGTKEFDAPRKVVWDAISDPEAMARLMPGFESFEVQDGTHWRAKVKVPLGIGGLRMTVDFEQLEERPLELASMRAKGRGVGAMMDMTTSFRLSGDDTHTSMAWEADVKMLGAGGAMGQRILQPVVNQQVEHVLSALEQRVASAQAG
jgi:carbon monoxide dehydrogenase subunit G